MGPLDEFSAETTVAASPRAVAGQPPEGHGVVRAEVSGSAAGKLGFPQRAARVLERFLVAAFAVAGRLRLTRAPKWVVPFTCGVVVGALLWGVVPRPADDPRPAVRSVEEPRPARPPSVEATATPVHVAVGPLDQPETEYSGPPVPAPDPESTRAVADESDDAERGAYFGSLTVSSLPEGASVLLNGQPVGTTPLTLLNQAVGSRAMRLEMDDHEPWVSGVTIVADTRTYINAQLTRQR